MTGGKVITIVYRHPVTRPGRQLGATGCCAGAVGTTTITTCAWRTATTAIRRITTTSSVFVVRLLQEIDLLGFCVLVFCSVLFSFPPKGAKIYEI